MSISSSPDFLAPRNAVKLFFWGGAVRLLAETPRAGGLMLEHPNHVVCHADSFYIGQPAPVLAVEDRLALGRAYFVIPQDRLPPPRRALTAASLPALSAAPKGSALDFGDCPFQCAKCDDGRTRVKVSPDCIARIMSAPGGRREGGTAGGDGDVGRSSGSSSCGASKTTQKRHGRPAGPGRPPQWSPKLETIPEGKTETMPSSSGMQLC